MPIQDTNWQDKLKQYLLQMTAAQPMEPMATAANAALGMPAPASVPTPDPERTQYPQVPLDPGVPPSAPIEMPAAAPKAALPVPMPVPMPVTPPQAAPRPMAAPNPVQSVYGSKYDDTARQALYDSLAQKRAGNAGWAAIGDVADMNANVGGGIPLNSGNSIRDRQLAQEKVAKGDFEAGRTAMVGEQEKATTAQDKRDALKAMLEQRALDRESRSEDRRLALDVAKTNKDITLGTKKDQFNEGLTSKLRGQIENHPVYKNYMTLHGATEQAKRAIENPSAYGDLSLIYSTIKGLDAQSSVREGEVKTMAEMASLKNRLLGSLQTLSSGQHLTPEQKADAKNVIASMEKIARDNVISTATPILAQAKRAGLQEGEINPLYQAPSAPAAGQPGRAIAAGWKVVR